MYLVLQVLAVILAAVTMGLALAHALELPGKMRLGREQYLAVQPIYYPGFTIGGGIAEVGAPLATLALLVTTPSGTGRFWLIAAALIALLAVQAVFWLLTQPVNKFWLRETELSGAATRFFDTRASEAPVPEWTAMRDRWERSHVLRAALAMLGLIFLVMAVAM
jgi:hypothetical protein